MSDQKFKADAGKPKPELLQVGMGRALRFVQATMEYGAEKYEAHSWRNVPDAAQRYLAAAERHRQERILSMRDSAVRTLEPVDHESGLPHVAHEIFNLLALIELEIQNNPGADWASYLNYNKPPTDHKEQ